MTRGGLSEHWVRSVGNVAGSPSTAVWSEVVVLAIRSDLSHLTDRHVTARPPFVVKCFEVVAVMNRFALLYPFSMSQRSLYHSMSAVVGPDSDVTNTTYRS